MVRHIGTPGKEWIPKAVAEDAAEPYWEEGSCKSGAIEVDEDVVYDVPDFVQLHKISADGWCFYDCILKHLFPNGQEGEESEKITKAITPAIIQKTHKKLTTHPPKLSEKTLSWNPFREKYNKICRRCTLCL